MSTYLKPPNPEVALTLLSVTLQNVHYLTHGGNEKEQLNYSEV